MARPATGEVIERQGTRGRAYVLRFRAYGKRHHLTVGNTAQGYTRAKAEAELANVLADVRRGIWQPPERKVELAAPEVEPTFHEFASEWFERVRVELRPNTVLDYEWQLRNHLLPFFAKHKLSEITAQEVDRFRTAQVRNSGLSVTSINKTLTRLAQVLDDAVDYGKLDHNAARGKKRRLKAVKPRRPFLDEPEQIAALLEAAAELDAEARRDRRGTPRRVILTMLVFSGLRIDELLSLRWRDVDLAAGRVAVGEAKTDAGVRRVDLLPVLREELTTYKARSKRTRSHELVFGTETGRKQNPSNVRNRVLKRAVDRANDKLEESENAPLPDGLTPHALRRTYASLLLALGNDPMYVMDQMGHTDPKLTLGIYAQMMKLRQGDRATLRKRLKALTEGAEWEHLGANGARAALARSAAD